MKDSEDLAKELLAAIRRVRAPTGTVGAALCFVAAELTVGFDQQEREAFVMKMVAAIAKLHGTMDECGLQTLWPKPDKSEGVH